MADDSDILATFVELDIDADGKITAEEMKKKLSEVNKGPVNMDNVHAFMAKFDADKDGCWSVNELVDFLKSLRNPVETEEA
ncbi:unnamed protein product [Calicophoron daubneyi]|uniref:EF-hand domain-containing protein n=1 Tax=Calicophoron daubneyi TaxID=300641 RepID=A0AAV2TUG6_CALDB